MDRKLRELERRIAQGDLEAEEELKRYLARTRTPAENLKQAFIEFLLDYDDEFDQYADEFLEVRGDALYFFTEDCTIVSYIEGIGPLQDVVDEHNFYTEPNEDIWGYTFHPKKPVKKKAPIILKAPHFQLLSTFIDENPLTQKDVKRLRKMFRGIRMSKRLNMADALCSYDEQRWANATELRFIIKVPIDPRKRVLFEDYLNNRHTSDKHWKVEQCVEEMTNYILELLEAASQSGDYGRLNLTNSNRVYIEAYYDDGFLAFDVTSENL
jgi:hypothetical protein